VIDHPRRLRGPASTAVTLVVLLVVPKGVKNEPKVVQDVAKIVKNEPKVVHDVAKIVKK